MREQLEVGQEKGKLRVVEEMFGIAGRGRCMVGVVLVVVETLAITKYFESSDFKVPGRRSSLSLGHNEGALPIQNLFS